ncbi:hypothetical protein D3C77_721660 [compost metagenome]
MDVVDIAYFRNIQAQVFLQFGDIHFLWRTFQQLVEALLQQPPGTAYHQAGYQYRQYRVDRRPAGGQDHNRRGNGTHRPQ